MWRIHAVYLAIITVLVLVIAVTTVRIRRAVDVDVLPAAAVRATPLPRWRHPKTLADSRAAIDVLVSRAAVEDFGAEPKLSAACIAAVEGGGRIRPCILAEVARAVNPEVDPSEAMLFAEYLHCASLVVDDMPSFDNDAERRGRPTVHVAHGAAVAQMATAALVAAALRNMCRQVDWLRNNGGVRNPDRIGTRVCHEMCAALGASGAAGGQLAELLHNEARLPESDICLHKTTGFFELATVAGWLVAGGDAGRLTEVRALGTHVGAAFQIADDICDLDADTQMRPGANYAAVGGLDAARRELQAHLSAARGILSDLYLESALWTQILGEIEGRAAA